MNKDKKSLELKKHVATIHSSNKLTLLQRKIANALLFNAYDSLAEKDEYEIHIGALCKLIGYRSNDHKTIKKALVNLLSTVVEWNLVDGDKLDVDGVWNASSIIADASIDGAICTYSYSNKMKRLLYRPELYGRLNMLVQSKFQSSYGLALYENCIRYQNIEQTPWFDLAQFRKLMGVEEGKYKVFRDFKHRVLDKAMEEVNKYSPIAIAAQLRKEKREVVAIQFSIKQAKESSEAIAFPKMNQSSSLPEILKSIFGLSKQQIDRVLTTYEESYIREKVQIIESSASFKVGKIQNLAKYLLSALSDDYQPTKSSASFSSAQTKSNKIELKNNNRIEQDKLEERRRQLDKQIIELFHKQPEVKKKLILSGFEPYLKGIYLNVYQRDGLENFQVKNQLCLFVKEKMPELLNEIVLEN